MQVKSDMKAFFTIKTLAYSVGGAEKLVCALAGLLAERGFEVHVLTFDRAEDVPFFHLHPAIIRHFAAVGDPSKKTRLSTLPRLLHAIRREITAVRPDVVFAFMHSSFVPVIAALAGTGIPVVLSEHTTPQHYKDRKLEFWALRIGSFFARSITIISQKIAALYPCDMRRKMAVLPNPVFSDFVDGCADKVEGQKTVLSVGRLDRGKDHAVLINAFANIEKIFPDWDLLIVGEGPERSNLETMIRNLGLETRVRLLGIVKDLDRVYSESSLFVMPSRYENFGMVTVEAMSHALPVIGFQDCTGTNELVAHEQTGLLVAKRSPDDLSTAMESLMRDAGVRVSYGTKGQEAAKRYMPENVGKEWAMYLRGLVSKSMEKV